jgi:hypothetical protein
MKKIALLFSAVALFAMTSCSKNACYECTLSASTVDVCDGKITTTVTGVPAVTVDLPSGTSEKEYSETLESTGYTCTKK